MRSLVCLLLQLLVFIPLSGHARSAAPLHRGETEKSFAHGEGAAEGALSAYGRLPLYFMKNTGQAQGAAMYMERGAGHAVFFRRDGLVLALARAGVRAPYAGAPYPGARSAGPRSQGTPASRGVPAAAQKRPAPLIPAKAAPALPGPAEAVPAQKSSIEAIRFTFVGADKDAALIAEDPLAGQVNYFTGSDSKTWKTHVPTYGALVYKDLYRDIDIRFYGRGRDLEHDIIVHPGGDPGAVRVGIDGIEGLELTEAGDLVLELKKGRIVQKKPLIYQVIEGRKRAVSGRYRIYAAKDGAPSYGFEVASYDRGSDLVIDPVLVYSTYLGGISIDAGLGIAVDGAGAAYISGYTISADFPLQNPIQGFGGFAYTDAFVTKLNPAGDALVYSTYIGGSLSDYGSDIAVDASGAAYISGSTSSTDYPLVSPIQPLHGGVVDVTITKLSPAGDALVYSSFIGGSDEDWALGVDIDSAGAAYLTGYALSLDYPLLNAVQPAFGGGLLDAFITKINPSGTAIVYSTYLGGASGEHGNDISVDASGAAYVTGQTWSADFPLVSPLQAALSGPNDAYAAKIAPGGTAIVYSTFLGGAGDDAGNAIVADAAGAAYVAGDTGSADFPAAGAAQPAYRGAVDAFVTKIAPTGAAIEYSTFLGGAGLDRAYGLAVDSSGSAYVTGQTFSPDFPLVDPVQSVFGGSDDGFAAELGPKGSLFVYSTFLGGADSDNGFAVAVDAAGAAYVTGFSYSADYPLKGPFQGFNGGAADAFVSKIGASALPPVTLLIRADTASVSPGGALVYTVSATNTTGAVQCFQYWENVTLPGGGVHPPAGELRGPVTSCLDAGASLTRTLSHVVPLSAPPGSYVLNAYTSDAYPSVRQSSSLNFSIGPPLLSPGSAGDAAGRPSEKGDRR